jgi:7,8-dihydroneopterin aldolase/epimerase/oxygenase
MLTVSLHGIRIYAPHGLYPQEHILGNAFEVDADVYIPVAKGEEWPFADYAIIHAAVAEIFNQPGHLLETFVKHIHAALKEKFPMAEKVRVAVRKLNPPMQGETAYSQVCYEA